MHHQQSCVVDSEISFYWPQYRPLLIQAQFFISPRPCLIITFSYWLIVMLVLIHICVAHFRNHLNETSLPLCTVVDYCIVYHPAPSCINPLSISSIFLSLLSPFYFDCSFPIHFRSRKHLLFKPNLRICNRVFVVLLSNRWLAIILIVYFGVHFEPPAPA